MIAFCCLVFLIHQNIRTMFKHIIFILLLAIGCNSQTAAQVSLKGIVGINFSNLSENPEGTEITGKAGYQFGGSLLIGDKFYIEPGFQVERNSRDFKYTEDGNYEFKVTEKWMKVPVHIGYHIAGKRGHALAIRIFGGPSVSFLGAFTSEDNLESFVEDDLKDARWAVDAGIGIDVLFLFAEFNYAYSLNKYSTIDNFDAKHGAYIINVGAKIDF